MHFAHFAIDFAGSMGEPQRLVSRQWSCGSLLSAVGLMDSAEFMEALPDDPLELGAFIEDLASQSFPVQLDLLLA